MATSQTEKPWVNIASRLIPLLTALVLFLGFALWHHLLTLNPHASRTVPPAEFVKAHANDAHSVVVSVRAVETAMLASYDAGVAGIAYRASLQHQLTDEKGKFEVVEQSLVSSASNPPTGRASDYNEMETAVEEFSSAVSTAKSFVDSKKPSELENYTEQWQLGRQQWNDAVSHIWNAAGQPPPTVDETAAAGLREDVS